MGLDQYAYVATSAGQLDKYYSDDEQVSSGVTKPREIAYWRKHPNLQGYMEKLFAEKGGVCETFNGVEVELTWDDVDKLEKAIKSGEVSELGTRGFFFGDPSDDYYRESDLAFIRNARAELFSGLRVFYNSSW